jgi:hypothetical protein
LENSEQRPAPETRVQSSEMPQIADQRPVPDSLTCGNVDAFPFWRPTSTMKKAATPPDFFFGRARETAEVIRALEVTPNKLPVLLGNSGAGKSSVAQAGVPAALKRQAWPENAGTPPA